MEVSAREKKYAFVLTLVQYLCLVLFLWQSPWLAKGFWLLLEVPGVFLGFYAIYAMRKSRLEISPLPKDEAKLIRSGPYRYIRHPMYAAILLTFTPLLISHFNLSLLLIFSILAINLFFKMHFEETLLLRKFYDYRQYSEKTKYLIPFIY